MARETKEFEKPAMHELTTFRPSTPKDWDSGAGCPPTSHLLGGANLQAVREAILKRSPPTIGNLPERPPRRILHHGPHGSSITGLLATPTKNVLLG